MSIFLPIRLAANPLPYQMQTGDWSISWSEANMEITVDVTTAPQARLEITGYRLTFASSPETPLALSTEGNPDPGPGELAGGGPPWDFDPREVRPEIWQFGSASWSDNVTIVGVTADGAGPIESATKAIDFTQDLDTPENTVLPFIVTNAPIGTELTGDAGEWENEVSFTYRWRRDGVAIGGATTTTYTPVAADDQTNLTFEVTATNASGSTVAISTPVFIVYPAPEASGTIDDVEIEVGDGDEVFDASTFFTGTIAEYSVSGHASVTIDPETGEVTINDDVPFDAEITVFSANSGGNATQVFQATVSETAPAAIGVGEITIIATESLGGGLYTARMELAEGVGPGSGGELRWTTAPDADLVPGDDTNHWVPCQHETGRQWTLYYRGGAATQWHALTAGQSLNNLVFRWRPVLGTGAYSPKGLERLNFAALAPITLAQWTAAAVQVDVGEYTMEIALSLNTAELWYQIGSGTITEAVSVAIGTWHLDPADNVANDESINDVTLYYPPAAGATYLSPPSDGTRSVTAPSGDPVTPDAAADGDWSTDDVDLGGGSFTGKVILTGDLAAAVEVQWTTGTPTTSYDLCAGYQPTEDLGGGEWRMDSCEGQGPGGLGWHLMTAGQTMANVGIRYRLVEDGPWSPISATRKSVVIPGEEEPPPPDPDEARPALTAGQWTIAAVDAGSGQFTGRITISGVSQPGFVEWTTNVPVTPEMVSGNGWLPTTLAVGLFTMSAMPPPATQWHLINAGATMSNIGIRIRDNASQAWSLVSADRKSFTAPGTPPDPDPPPPGGSGTPGSFIALSSGGLNQALGAAEINYGTAGEIGSTQQTNANHMGVWTLPLVVEAYRGNTSVTSKLVTQFKRSLNTSTPMCMGGWAMIEESGMLISMQIARRYVPAVWNQLSSAERTRVDLLTQAMICASCYMSADSRAGSSGVNNFQFTSTNWASGADTYSYLRSWGATHSGNKGVRVPALGLLRYETTSALNNFLNTVNIADLKAAGVAAGLTHWTSKWPTGVLSGIQSACQNYSYFGRSITDPQGILMHAVDIFASKVISCGYNGDGPTSTGRGAVVCNCGSQANRGLVGMDWAFRSDQGAQASSPPQRSSLEYAAGDWRAVHYSLIGFIFAGFLPNTTAWVDRRNRLIRHGDDIVWKMNVAGYTDARGTGVGNGPTWTCGGGSQANSFHSQTLTGWWNVIKARLQAG